MASQSPTPSPPTSPSTLQSSFVSRLSWFQKIHRTWFTSHPVLVGLSATLVAIVIQQLGGWQPLERLAYNMLFQARQWVPSPGWDQRIAVIAIDEISLEAYGSLPWPRDRYAKLLEILEATPPAVIGFDILFAEPDPQDQTFADAILNTTGGNVVLATATDRTGKRIPVVPILAKASTQGHVLYDADRDGIGRQFSLYINQFPSFGIEVLKTYNHVLQQIISADQPLEPAVIPEPTSTGESDQPMWINWPDSVKNSQTYSFVALLQGEVDPAIFQNKIVLIGLTATGLDPLQTPLDQTPPTNGIYIHAALIDNLLNQRSLKRLSPWLDPLLLLGFGSVLSLVWTRQKYQGRLATILLVPILWFTGAFLLFWLGHWWIPIAAPLGTTLLVGFGLQLREQKEKQELMTLFATHLSPDTADVIWQRRHEIFQSGELTAQEMVATILFTDIRGFTSISEQFQPTEMIAWLNRYLDAMTDCIMDHGGMVDKYIGDEIMAIFGAPFPHDDPAAIQQDAERAIAASLAMWKRLQTLNATFKTEGLPNIQVGTGIHTGKVVAGSVGGRRRLNYSVIGDTVNVASRIQSMNKELIERNPCRILVTEDTMSYVGNKFPHQLVSTVMLRGRQQPTTLFAILDQP